jgi:hypothetical protein
MPTNTTILLDLHDWVTARYEHAVVKMQDQFGNQSTDKAKIFTYVLNIDKAPVTISFVDHLADPRQSLDMIKVTFDHHLIKSSEPGKNITKLCKILKSWAVSKLLGFDIKDSGQSSGLRESKFSAMSGNMKTSVQKLPKAKLIIKHSDNIDESVMGARTRKIHKIYVENSNGERFLLPNTNLRGARVMARHVDQGGNPYDKRGQGISNLTDEMLQLRSFVRKTKEKYNDNEMASNVINAAIERLMVVKKLLNRGCSERGYNQCAPEFEVDNSEIEYTPDVKNNFIVNKFDDRIESGLPYAWRAYNMMKKMPEVNEFEKWSDDVVSEMDSNPSSTSPTSSSSSTLSPDSSTLAVQTALGIKNGKQPLKVERTPKGNQIEYDPKDGPTRDKIAAAVKTGKVGSNVAITTMSENVTNSEEPVLPKNKYYDSDANDPSLLAAKATRLAFKTGKREDHEAAFHAHKKARGREFAPQPPRRSNFQPLVDKWYHHDKQMKMHQAELGINESENNTKQDFKVVFKTPYGHKVVKVVTAHDEASAELEAYNKADAQGWEIVKVMPMGNLNDKTSCEMCNGAGKIGKISCSHCDGIGKKMEESYDDPVGGSKTEDLISDVEDHEADDYATIKEMADLKSLLKRMK